MSKGWLAGMLACWLAGSDSVRADEPFPLDPLPLDRVSALLPQTPRTPTERPTDLPNIDPRTDIPPLIRQQPNPAQAPARPQRRFGPASDYNPSYLYLPERNPGFRQAPCPCLPLGEYWFNAAYFYGKTQNDSIPPLVTQGGNGIPGSPGTSVLQGNQRLDHPFQSGLRIEGGKWMDRCHNWGIEGSFFYLGSTKANFLAASSGDPLLARPFSLLPGEAAGTDLISMPGTARGVVSVESPLSFQGADVNTRLNLFCEDYVRIDFLSGYRFVRMAEGVSIHSQSDTFAGPGAGSVREVQDNFHTLNLFNGGQIGLAGEYRFDRVYIAAATKAAFGVNWHRMDVDGSTRTQTAGGGSTTVPVGLLSQKSNIGTTYESHFAVVPEANFTLGYQVNDHWRAYAGYSFIYISSVARPGQSIDTTFGTSANGTVHPTTLSPNTDFWMHGINLGLEARY